MLYEFTMKSPLFIFACVYFVQICLGAAIETTEIAVDDQPVGKRAGIADDNDRARKESLETADGDKPRKTLDEHQSVNKLTQSNDEDRSNEIAHSYLENLRVDLKKDPSLNATTIDKIVSIFQRNFAITFASWALAKCEYFYGNVIWMNIASSNSESFTSSDLKRIEYALGETNTPNHLIKQVQRIFSVFRPNASELDREMAVRDAIEFWKSSLNTVCKTCDNSVE